MSQIRVSYFMDSPRVDNLISKNIPLTLSETGKILLPSYMKLEIYLWIIYFIEYLFRSIHVSSLQLEINDLYSSWNSLAYILLHCSLVHVLLTARELTNIRVLLDFVSLHSITVKQQAGLNIPISTPIIVDDNWLQSLSRFLWDSKHVIGAIVKISILQGTENKQKMTDV